MVPDVVDDGRVAFQCREKYTVGRCAEKAPERCSRQPVATDELIIDAVGRHTSAVHFGNGRQQREERAAHVHDALVHDQNVDCLKQ